MGKSSKKSGVEVATTAISVPEGKSGKKGKRNAEDEIEKAVSAKKQKTVPEKVVPVKEDAKKVKKQPPPKKVESSSSEEDSSESEEEVKVQPKKNIQQKKVAQPAKQESSDDSSDDSSSDDKPAAPVKKPSVATTQKKTQESDSSDSDSDDESDEDNTIKTVKPVQTAAVKKKEESSDSSDSDSESESESDSDEPAKPTIPAKRPLTTDTKKGQSKDDSEDSSDESSEESDDEPPQKKIKESTTSGTTKPSPKAAKKESSSDEESDDDDSSDESSDEDDKQKQTQAKKQAPVAQESSSSDESSEEDTDMESDEPAKTPKKKETAVPVGSNKSVTKAGHEEPKTPASNQNQATGSKTLFVGNLSYSVDQEQVKQFFQEAGEIVDIRFSTFEDGSFRGFGHVEFATAEAAKKALELAGHDLMGRPVKLDMARERGAYTPGSGGDNSSFKKPAQSSGNTIFIRGFDTSLDIHQIRGSLEEHFGSCGEITRVSVPKDYETGASKGMAYMDFADNSSLSKAFELNGSDLGGFSLYVDEARPRPDSTDGGNFSSGRDFNNSGRGGRRGGRSDGGRGRGDRGRGRGFGRGGDRGRGGRGTPFRQSAGTPSAGKKTTFGDDD
uniref:RRM domain-containing protein n=1 Tax=Leersia perrieri TaxID=77586 RepID=A0A0D9W9M5_9ORYZ